MDFDRRLLFRHAVVISALAMTTLVSAQDRPDTPTSVPGGKIITVEEGKKLLDAKGAAFIDMRSAMGYAKGRVPGAVSATYTEKSDYVANFDASMDKMDSTKLPADKAKPLVFYGHGASGWKGYKGAVLAAKAGHKNVMFMRDGWAGWEAKAYPAER